MKKILITILILCLFASFGFAQAHKDGAHKGSTLIQLQQGAAEGDIIYWNGSAWVVLNIGSNTEVLTSNGTIPTWGAGGGGGWTDDGTVVRLTTAGDSVAIGTTDATGQLTLASSVYHNSISTSVAEGATTPDLRIALSEEFRTLTLCDSGDAATDFGITTLSNPQIAFVNAAGSVVTTMFQGGSAFTIYANAAPISITHKSGFTTAMVVDLAAGDANMFESSASIELTDANGRQAWLHLEPKVNQTSTGAFDGLYVNADISASLGDGSTGDGNNLLNLSVAGAPEFTVSTTGAVTVDGTINFAADSQGDDDYEIALPNIAALTTGLTVTFTANTANTDGATLEITSVGDLDAIVIAEGASVATALATGEILAGQVVTVVFDGTNWQVTSRLGNDRN